MEKLFSVSQVREWLDLYDNEEITFSRFVELFNQKVFESLPAAKDTTTNQYNSLRLAVKNLLLWLKEKRPDTPGLGGPISMVKQVLDAYQELAAPQPLPNCLGYALRFWERQPQYRLYYNSSHVINSNVPITGEYWLPAEDYGLIYFKEAFNGLLDNHELKLLDKYFKIEQKNG